MGTSCGRLNAPATTVNNFDSAEKRMEESQRDAGAREKDNFQVRCCLPRTNTRSRRNNCGVKSLFGRSELYMCLIAGGKLTFLKVLIGKGKVKLLHIH